MRALLAGEWSETETREIDWSQWELDTVRTYLDWIYQRQSSYPVLRGTPLTLEYNLLEDAKLYALAQYTDTSFLRISILDHIEWALSYNKGEVSIIKLIRYVYDNTDSLENGVEPLRKAVCTYCVNQFPKLHSEEGFRMLMVQGGDFVGDLWDMLGSRVIKDGGKLVKYYRRGSHDTFVRSKYVWPEN